MGISLIIVQDLGSLSNGGTAEKTHFEEASSMRTVTFTVTVTSEHAEPAGPAPGRILGQLRLRQGMVPA